MRLVGKFRFAALVAAVLVVSAVGCAGATLAFASGEISGHLTNANFTPAQAKSVKVIYTISKRGKACAYSLSIKSGSKYKLIKKVTKKGSFKGRGTMTMTQVFAGKAIKVGNYRLTLSCDKGQQTLAFTVIRATVPSNNPGTKASKLVRAVFTAADARFDSAGRNIDRDIRTGVRTWTAQGHSLNGLNALALQGLQLPGTTQSHVRTLQRITNRLIRDLNAVSPVTSVDRRAKQLALSFARSYLTAVAALAVLTSPSASSQSKARAEQKAPAALKAAERAAKRANSLIGCTPSRCGGFFGKPTAFPAAGAPTASRITAASTPTASAPKCENCELNKWKAYDFYDKRMQLAAQNSGGWAAAGDLALVLGQMNEYKADLAKVEKNCKNPARYEFTEQGPLTSVYTLGDEQVTEKVLFRGSLDARDAGFTDPFSIVQQGVERFWSMEISWTDSQGRGSDGWEQLFPMLLVQGDPRQIEIYGAGLLINAHYQEFLGQPWIDPDTMTMVVGTGFGFEGFAVGAGVLSDWSGSDEVPIKCTPRP